MLNKLKQWKATYNFFSKLLSHFGTLSEKIFKLYLVREQRDHRLRIRNWANNLLSVAP
jgi:hypothetical protein